MQISRFISKNTRLTAVSKEEKIQRGMRIRQLRTSLRYSTRKFEAKYAIKASTIKGWERGEGGGLTADGALRLIDAFQKEGLYCSLDWLFYGQGPHPLQQDSESILSNALLLTRELELFHELHPGAVDVLIQDDGMQPYLSPGDHVAGIRNVGNHIDKLIGQHCIAELQRGDYIVRQLSAGTESGRYTLTCLNPRSKATPFTLKNVELISAAYINWIRKPALAK